jgi:phosphoenolpyruvate carboxylase
MSEPIPLHSADIDPSVSPLQNLAQKLGAGGVPAATAQRELARALGFVLLDTLKNDARYMQELALPGIDAQPHPLHVWLGSMLDATWPDQWDAAQEAKFNTLASALLAVKDPDIQHPCIKFLTRLGHLHQLAGLLARDNLLQQTDGPSTARSFLNGDLGSKRGKNYTSPEAAVAALNRPAFELTFTAHPTNTSSIASMQDLRELGELLARWKKDDGSDPKLLPPQIRSAIQSYGDTPILPMDGEKPRAMTVREEVDHMLYYLGNSYADLPRVYASYDKALNEKFADRYHPETLKLGVKFHSWGSSGDKDGNARVNADTTLYALAAHYAEILERYRKDLRPVPGMYDWQEKIESACASAKTVQYEMRELLDGRQRLSEAKFDQLSTQ